MVNLGVLLALAGAVAAVRLGFLLEPAARPGAPG
jgi:hypothetical protein